MKFKFVAKNKFCIYIYVYRKKIYRNKLRINSTQQFYISKYKISDFFGIKIVENCWISLSGYNRWKGLGLDFFPDSWSLLHFSQLDVRFYSRANYQSRKNHNWRESWTFENTKGYFSPRWRARHKRGGRIIFAILSRAQRCGWQEIYLAEKIVYDRVWDGFTTKLSVLTRVIFPPPLLSVKLRIAIRTKKDYPPTTSEERGALKYRYSSWKIPSGVARNSKYISKVYNGIF